MVEFAQVSERLKGLGIEQHASELHGLVSGYVCGGGDNVLILLDWLGYEADGNERDLIEGLLEEAGTLLADPEFGFQPVVPDEKQFLTERSEAISRWAGGFISGFGAAGGFGEDELEEEVKEVLSDLHKISAMSDEVPESEENEADLTEILEYVRVSALLVFATCALPAGEPDEGES